MSNLQMAGQLSIGALARRTGLNVSAIRYYEEVGLVKPAGRRDSGHRVYGADAEGVLTLVRRCRDFGFSVDETRNLVQLSTNNSRDCVEARDIAQMHLKAVRSKLLELHALESNLARFVQACTDQCAGGPAPDCSILKDISQSGKKKQASSGCC